MTLNKLGENPELKEDSYKIPTTLLKSTKGAGITKPVKVPKKVL
jgi:hypothetical protein